MSPTSYQAAPPRINGFGTCVPPLASYRPLRGRGKLPDKPPAVKRDSATSHQKLGIWKIARSLGRHRRTAPRATHLWLSRRRRRPVQQAFGARRSLTRSLLRHDRGPFVFGFPHAPSSRSAVARWSAGDRRPGTRRNSPPAATPPDRAPPRPRTRKRRRCESPRPGSRKASARGALRTTATTPAPARPDGRCFG